MGGAYQKRLISGLIISGLLTTSALAFAQDNGQKDSLVRLVQGKSVQMVTPSEGEPYRKAMDATFLHNGTYLLCDSAFWYVDRNVIEAMGHVRLKQNSTTLTSDRLDYIVDDDLAKFRGGIVQLRDTSGSVLRTRILDYNTKDSVAVFKEGGAMRDKDGQIIESRDGTYDSKQSLFTFSRNVNMFTDSIFIKTESLDYHSDQSLAVFTSYIDFWNDEDMLSATKGWYNKDFETFFFHGAVHGLSKNQETWSDTLYYYQSTGDVYMRGNAQVQDDGKGTAAFADDIYYTDSLSLITLTRRAAGAVISGENENKDTLYCRADTINYWTVKLNEISDSQKSSAQSRLEDMLTDPVGEYIRKAAEEALKRAEESRQKVAKGTRDMGKEGEKLQRKQDSGQQVPENAGAQDTAAMSQDSLGAGAIDTIPHIDSSKTGFAKAFGNVLMFRKDMQVKCDSMRYTDLDSIARLYKSPTVWNEGRRQYTSDSIFILVRGGKMDRASLLSNAFVATENDTVHYDQIKGAEILAFFDTSSALKRFDALGGALATFYITENDALSTVNKVDTKMLSGTFKDGQIDRMKYYEAPKNDAYPVAQIPETDLYLKGFQWLDDQRPQSRLDITSMEFKPSESESYRAHPQPEFKQTDVYFNGYMKNIRKAIARAKKAREEASRYRDSLAAHPLHPDSLMHDSLRVDSLGVDSLGVDSLLQLRSLSVDSLQLDSLHSDSLRLDSLQLDSLQLDSLQLDSLQLDSLAVADSLSIVEPVDSAALERARKIALRDSIRLAKRAELEAKIALKDSIKQARWAELDSLDSVKVAARDYEKLLKKREATRKALIAQQDQAHKDAKKFDRYVRKYTKQKQRRDGRNTKKVSPLRGSGHAEQRGEPDPAIKPKATQPLKTPLQRVDIPRD